MLCYILRDVHLCGYRFSFNRIKSLTLHQTIASLIFFSRLMLDLGWHLLGIKNWQIFVGFICLPYIMWRDMLNLCFLYEAS